jgi:hypothetical protein
VRTELRLVLCYRGWEYTILKRDTTHRDPGPEQTIRVMVRASQWAACGVDSCVVNACICGALLQLHCWVRNRCSVLIQTFSEAD